MDIMNGFGIRLNGSGYQLKKNCHPFKRLGLSEFGKNCHPGVGTAWAIRLKKVVVRSNRLGYPFEKIVICSNGPGYPFEKEFVGCSSY